MTVEDYLTMCQRVHLDPALALRQEDAKTLTLMDLWATLPNEDRQRALRILEVLAPAQRPPSAAGE